MTPVFINAKLNNVIFINSFFICREKGVFILNKALNTLVLIIKQSALCYTWRLTYLCLQTEQINVMFCYL